MSPPSGSSSPYPTEHPGKLIGWKDISAHVGKAPRTVQRWEKDFGLPVHRLGREGGEVIFAFVDEIDAWMRSQQAAGARRSNGNAHDEKAEPDETAAATPSVAATVTQELGVAGAAEAGHRRRRFGWRAVAAGAALLVTGLGAGVLLAKGAAWLRLGPPADWRVAGNTLTIVDAAGRALWTKTFDPLVASAYGSAAHHGPTSPVRIADLDGDGPPEVLFRRLAAEPHLRNLHVFEADGRVRFVRDIVDTRTYGDSAYASPWIAYQFFLLPEANGRPSLWLSSIHSTEFPTLLEELAPDGRPRSAYWSNGYVDTVATGRMGGRDALIVGATNNDTRGASLAVFDRGHVNGSAPAANAHYRCRDCPPGEPLVFLVFPRMCPAAAVGAQAVIGATLLDDAEQLTVMVDQTGDGTQRAVVHYRFDRQWRLLSAELHPSYQVIHRLMERDGRLDHPFGTAEQALATRVLRWDRNRFVDVEKADALLAPSSRPTPFFGTGTLAAPPGPR